MLAVSFLTVLRLLLDIYIQFKKISVPVIGFILRIKNTI